MPDSGHDTRQQRATEATELGQKSRRQAAWRRQQRQAGTGGGNPPLLQLRLSLRQGLLRRGHRGLSAGQLLQPAGRRGSVVEEGGSAGAAPWA